MPDTLLPPVTLPAASVTEARRGAASGSGPRLMNADLVTPPAVASIRTVVAMLTGLVLIVKLFADCSRGYGHSGRYLDDRRIRSSASTPRRRPARA